MLHRRLFLLHRFMAVLGVVLVLILMMLAVRRDWHEALCHHHGAHAQHANPTADDDAGCVVTHFAKGHFLAALFLLLLLVGLVRTCAFLVQERREYFAAPTFQLPPVCGPPVA